ncbi:uncharacterized protein [Haliotis cracherodii]|uniref:uncharacterized protein isoform X3 n=1 Tax=Haliotis cracherodii TaxID=6455 RepID=UPI0039EC1221
MFPQLNVCCVLTAKTDLDYTEMEAKLKTTYGLCIALLVITATSLCLNIKNACPWPCGGSKKYSNVVQWLRGEPEDDRSVGEESDVVLLRYQEFDD